MFLLFPQTQFSYGDQKSQYGKQIILAAYVQIDNMHRQIKECLVLERLTQADMQTLAPKYYRWRSIQTKYVATYFSQDIAK